MEGKYLSSQIPSTLLCFLMYYIIQILLKDHYYNTKFDHFLLRIADYIGNKGLGINLIYNYLKESEWRLLIKQLNLKIIKLKKFKYNYLHPNKEIILKLNK